MIRKKEPELIIKSSKKIFKDGFDSTGNTKITVLHITYKKRDAYIYFSSDGGMSGAFGNDCKWQYTVLNGDNSKIWKYIKSLDFSGSICLNDVHDKINTKYERFWSRFDEDKLNLVEQQLAKKLGSDSDFIDYVKSSEKFSTKNCIIAEFIDQLDKNISELQETAWSQHWNDRELILQSILFILLTSQQFFEDHISIDDKIIKQLKCSRSVDTYDKIQQMKKLQLELKSKGKQQNNLRKI